LVFFWGDWKKNLKIMIASLLLANKLFLDFFCFEWGEMECYEYMLGFETTVIFIFLYSLHLN